MEIVNLPRKSDPHMEQATLHNKQSSATHHVECTQQDEKYEIIIEEITRNHKLLHRHPLNQQTITIGRGYENDIILNDPYICPEHLSLNYSVDGFYLTDHRSVNGTKIERPQGKKRVSHPYKINDGDVIMLGKSQLRIRFKHHFVAETIPLSPIEPLIELIRNPLAVIATVALFMLITANNTYLNQVSETNISQLFVGALSKVLLFGLWPAAIALISLLTKNEPRLLAQIGVSFCIFILMWISDLLESVLVFNTASNAFVGIFITVVTIVLAFSLFWLNSYIGFHVRPKRRAITALSITALLFGGSYLLQYSQAPEFDPRPHYSSTIMAPNYLFASSNTVESFIKDSELLFKQADELALKGE